MFSQETLSYIGIIALILLVVFVLLLLFSTTAVYFIFRDKGLVERIYSTFSHIVLDIMLFFLDLSYIPLKKIISVLGRNSNRIDIVLIEIRNMLLKNSFSNVPFKDRLVLIPQCLRNIDCKTTFNSVEGARCLKCGKCKIVDIVNKSEELGYMGAYIAPGGGFVRRIIKEKKPKAVLGIGCAWEVNAGILEVASKGIPVQGVILLRDGCVETDVDLEQVFEVMEYGK
ncbi:MAG: DUF116 domain-containing protein [Candidatus Altiarchaeota archaeon]|nr:DUF116 domain-containing protein [Candidatus Altiarchaeota archaeon]